MRTFTGSNCDVRNTCLAGCDATENAARAAAAELTRLRDEAIVRLQSDVTAALRSIQSELDTQVAGARTAADQAMADYRRALSFARAQVRGQATAAMDAAVAAQNDIILNFSPRMNAATTCMAGAVPGPVQQAYGEMRTRTQQWLSQAQPALSSARTIIDNGRNQAESAATQLFAEPGQTLAALTTPFQDVRDLAKEIESDLKSPPNDPAAFKTLLEGYINDGFQAIATKGAAGVTAARTAGATALSAIQTLANGSSSRLAQARDNWKTGAENALASIAQFDPARDVPSMQTLRARLRAEVAEWPKVMGCLCKTVDVPPWRQSTNVPIHNAANGLEDLTDALCAASMVMGRLPQTPQKLSELRARRAQPPPIATGFNPDAAQSAPGRAALASTARAYDLWTAAQHEHNSNVFDCVETRSTDRQRVQACGGNQSMSNSGALVGKLLAARAYRFGILAAEGSAEAPAALAALERSLAGMHAIMTLAGDERWVMTGLSDNQRVGSVKGLPIRGYVDATLGNAEPITIEASTDPEAKKRFFKVYAAPEGLSKAIYHFKERESPDDTFPTMIGLTAAYDVLKRHNQLPEWRQRIVEAAEAFGEYYVRDGARFKIKTLRGEDTWAGDASDLKNPFHLIQNLVFLKAVIYLSEDLRGNESKVGRAKTAYNELTAAIGRDRLRDPSLLGMAALLSAPARLALREPMMYFYPAFTVDMWVMSGYLLIKYEQDASQREVYREVYRKVIAPLAVDYRVAMHDLAGAASIPSASQFAAAAGMTRAAAIGRAAGSLRQFRTSPAPFDNPLPEFNDPAKPGFYYTDFSKRPELHDPLYMHLKSAWVTLRQQHPRVWAFLTDKSGSFETLFGEDQGSAWPLGQGLVPKGNNSGPFALVGGHWNDQTKSADVFAADVIVNGAPVKAIKAFSAVEMLWAYWFGQAHGLLRP